MSNDLLADYCLFSSRLGNSWKGILSMDQCASLFGTMYLLTGKSPEVLGNCFKTIFTRYRRNLFLKRGEETNTDNLLDYLLFIDGQDDVNKQKSCEELGGIYMCNLTKALAAIVAKRRATPLFPGYTS